MQTTAPVATATLSPSHASEIFGHFMDLGLLSEGEKTEALAFFRPDFPFAEAFALADSIHLHIKVDDTAAMPHEKILAHGGRPENSKHGYVKYAFEGGVNMIFSSINVAQDDLVASLPKRAKPVLDHIGVDLRRENEDVRRVFDQINAEAARLGWSHASQGAPGKPVYCCHIEVAAKHWVYPHGCSRHFSPIEFAFGPLKINPNQAGCDLRPMDPSNPEADRAPSCCG